MGEEERVIDALEEEVVVHHHVSQSAFEQQTLAELFAKKPYPLDGRNLEIGSGSMRMKRKRLQNVEEKPTINKDKILRSKRSDIGELSEVGIENFTCPSSLWEKLFEFQREGVRFLLSKYSQNTGGLLADEMGLGKSVQVVAFLSSIAASSENLDPVLIIAPTTLVAHWISEFAKWDISHTLLEVSKFEDNCSFGRKRKVPQVYVVSYETFRVRSQEFLDSAWSVVVLDEAQRIRNPDAKTTLAVKQLNCYCRIALSGSPIQNNLPNSGRSLIS